MFFNVCLHSRSFPLRADWRKSDSSVEGEPQGNWWWNSNSRDLVATGASSPSFSGPAARALRRACSQASQGLQTLALFKRKILHFATLFQGERPYLMALIHLVLHTVLSVFFFFQTNIINLGFFGGQKWRHHNCRPHNTSLQTLVKASSPKRQPVRDPKKWKFYALFNTQDPDHHTLLSGTTRLDKIRELSPRTSTKLTWYDDVTWRAVMAQRESSRSQPRAHCRHVTKNAVTTVRLELKTVLTQ